MCVPSLAPPAVSPTVPFALRRPFRRRRGFSLGELIVAMAILGIVASTVVLVRGPSNRTRVREDTQRLGLRIARAIAWSREMGQVVQVVPTSYGFIVGRRPAGVGNPGMADVNALGAGMNDNGRVGMEVTAGAATAIAPVGGGQPMTALSCHPRGTCAGGVDGVVFTITLGRSVGQVFVNNRGRVRVVVPTR